MATRDLARAARAIEEFLDALGLPIADDPELEGTGPRVAQAFAEDLLTGYAEDPAAILRDTTATQTPGPVLVTDIPTTTVCPHHLMPASGVAHVGYLPGERVVGFGALGRLVQCHARRLALQEDIAHRVVEDLVEHLGARAAVCSLSLTPTCMTARGGRAHGAIATTLASAGPDADAFRAEFLALARSPG